MGHNASCKKSKGSLKNKASRLFKQPNTHPLFTRSES